MMLRLKKARIEREHYALRISWYRIYKRLDVCGETHKDCYPIVEE